MLGKKLPPLHYWFQVRHGHNPVPALTNRTSIKSGTPITFISITMTEPAT